MGLGFRVTADSRNMLRNSDEITKFGVGAGGGGRGASSATNQEAGSQSRAQLIEPGGQNSSQGSHLAARQAPWKKEFWNWVPLKEGE